MKDTFSRFHPVVNFTYFTAAIVFGMFFMHPVFLGVALTCATAYSIVLNGKKAVRFNFLYMLPLLVVMAVINPLLNHAGVTILLYLNDNPITLEAIVYGVASAVMFVSVLLWFSCYNAVMTSDKFIYLFGKIIPALSLILSMALRFVPKFKAQIRVISHAQKCIGRDASKGNVFTRARNGMRILSILVTWALENAIDTADSMRCRGYGLKGRTAFSNYRFDKRDRTVFIVMSGLIALVLIGLACGFNTAVYYPAYSVRETTPLSFVFYAAYAALLLIPITVNVLEDLKWRRLKSMI